MRRGLLCIPLLLCACLPRTPEQNLASLKDEEGALREEIKHIQAQLSPLGRPTEQALQALLPPGTVMVLPGGRVGPFRVQWRGVHAGVRLTGSAAPREDSVSSPATLRVVRGGK